MEYSSSEKKRREENILNLPPSKRQKILESQATSFLSFLPQEIWKEHILIYLDEEDLKTFRECSKFTLFLTIQSNNWKPWIRIDLLKVFQPHTFHWPFAKVYGVYLQTPEEIENFQYLPLYDGIQALDISHCQIIQLNDSHLSYLPTSLTRLDLSNASKITDNGLITLSSSITDLNLRGCPKITDKTLNRLATSLSKLQLSYCSNITDEAITRLSCLTHLSVANIKHFSCLQVHLAEFPFLTEIHLINIADLTDENLKYLPVNVTYLNISSCSNITDEGLTFLPSMLCKLNLSYCPNIFGNTFQTLNSCLTSLTLLGFSQINRISYFPSSLIHLDLTSQAREEVFKCLPSALRSLSVMSCANLNEASIKAFPKTLKTLNLASCQIKDQILQFLPALQSLDISNCISTTMECHSYLPTSLTYLGFAYNSIVNDQSVLKLPSFLQSLSLANSTNLTDQGLRFLPPHLKSLDLSYCNSITNQGLGNLPLSSLLNLNLSNCDQIYPKKAKGFIQSVNRQIKVKFK